MPVYELDGEQYDVPEGTTLDELNAVISGGPSTPTPTPEQKLEPATLEERTEAIMDKVPLFGKILRGTQDIQKGMAIGVLKGMSSIAQLPVDFVKHLEGTGAVPFIDPSQSRGTEHPFQKKSREFRESLPQPETLPGQLAEGVSKVGVGIAGAGKFKVGSAWLTRMAQGAAIDFSIFSPEEKNLSNFIQEQPALANIFSEALANDEDDSVVRSRLKNAIEGGIIGGTVEALFKAWKAGRGAYVARQKKAADELFDKVIDTKSSVKQAKSTVDSPVDTMTDPKNIEIDTTTSVRSAKEESEAILSNINSRTPPEFKLHPSDGNAVINTKVSEPMVKSVALAAEAAAQGDEVLAKELLKKNGRLFSKITDAILMDELQISSLPELLGKYNLSPTEFAIHWKKSISSAGRSLAHLSHIKRRMLKTFGDDAASKTHMGEIKKHLDEWVDDGDTSSLISYVTGGIENTRRAILVTQWKTAIRNWRTQSIRAVIGDVDEMFQATLRGALNDTIYAGKKVLGKPAKKPLGVLGELATVHSNVAAGVRQLPFASKLGSTSQKELFNFLDSQAGAWAKARLNTATMLEVYNTGGKWDNVLQTLNFVNRTQENFFRRAAFEAKGRQLLKRRGLSFTADNLKKLGNKEMDELIDHTLELTFAASPKHARMKRLVRTWSNTPFLTIINPFPRFHFANALPFFYNFSPIGFMRPKTVRSLLTGNVDELAETGSRTAIGSAMWYAGWQMYQNFGSAERWFEMQVPVDYMASLNQVQLADINKHIEDEQKAGRVKENEDGSALMFDVRGDAPLTSMFFVMHGIDGIIRGKEPWDNIKPADVVQQMVGLNKVAGTGIEIFDLFKARKEKDYKRIVHNIAAQYIGSFSVPFRQFKDLYTEIDPGEAIQRDLRQSSVWAPFFNNIPVLSQDYPPAFNPFKEGNLPEINREGFTLDNIEDQLVYDASVERFFANTDKKNGGVGKPLFTQALGLTLKHKEKLEREVDRLSINKQTIYARSGDKRTDNLLNGYRGYFASRYIKPIITSPLYNKMTDPQKRLLLGNFIASGRKFSSAILAGKHQGLYLQAMNKGFDQDILDLAKENGFDVETYMNDLAEAKKLEGPPEEVAPDIEPR